MKCPSCGATTSPTELKSIRVDRCPSCGGVWCDRDQLRLLKDREAHGDYRWIDVDLWKDASKLRSGRQRGLRCPGDEQAMTTVHYGESDVSVDICGACQGVWLDGTDYERIVAYLNERVNAETVTDYLDDVREEFVEVFTGPEGPLSELKDLVKVLYLLQLRFAIEHLNLSSILARIGRGIPGA